MRSNFCVKVVYFAALLLLMKAPLYAGNKSWLDPGAQRGVIFLQTDGQTLTHDRHQQWLQFCQGLGSRLIIEQPGSGFLSSYRCEVGADPKVSVRDFDWLLIVYEKEKFIDVEVQFWMGTQWQVVQTFSFHFQNDWLVALQKNTALDYLSRMILESLPTGWAYKHRSGTSAIHWSVATHLPKLPSSLYVYQLRFDQGRKIWLPQVRAVLKRNDLQHEPGNIRKESFEIVQSWLPLVDGQSYWVQSVDGRNQRQDEYEKKLQESLGGFSILNLVDRLLFESFSSNYAGVRWGKSFLRGDSILTQSQLVSVLVEMRNGPLAGLRWYYDFSPRSHASRQGLEEYFAMKRASLGWAIEWRTPRSMQSFLSRLDLQPKVGLLDITSQFVAEDSLGNLRMLGFSAHNILSLSLELGLEKETSWFRHRLWTSLSSARFGLRNRAGVSVTSTKAGLDNYFELGKWHHAEMGILLFGLAENLSLSRDSSKILDLDDVGISELSFNLFFLGGGVTVSW